MFKVGDLITPIRNSNSHSYSIGKKYRVIRISGNQFTAEDPETRWVGNSLLHTDCKAATTTKKDIKKSIKTLEDELNKFNKMLEFIEETEKDIIVPNEFISWYLLKIMKSDDSDKFNKISKVLNTITNNISVDFIKHV